MHIDEIQKYLRENDLDGWLMADFHARNEIAMEMLGIRGMLTRRSFYFIPVEGEPTALVNPIEAAKFRGLPGTTIRYRGYRGVEDELKKVLAGRKRVAMEYSPSGRLPYIGLVDAGTIELVRSLGVDVVTSADLVAHFQARLTPEQMASHRMAARNVGEIKDAAFAFIGQSLKAGESVTEFDVVEFIRKKFDEYDMETDHGPNCSVDGHAGDPHYEPTAEKSAQIKKGQLILIDLWAKLKTDQAVYADITWMAFAGSREEIPKRYAELFKIVVSGRDAAVAFLRETIGNRPVMGWEVDDACRKVIDSSEHGAHFVHRTGHSIATNVHGPGPNIDNLETEDSRELRQGHLFSIEPGLYFEDCGFRSEIDGLITHNGLEINTLPLQFEILPLL